MSFPSYVVLTTAVADRASAERIAGTLVGERLAGCVQVIGPIVSHYRWKGVHERSEEWRLECKTTAGRLGALERRLLELHPYELPEILTLPVIQGSDGYLRWLDESTQAEGT